MRLKMVEGIKLVIIVGCDLNKCKHTIGTSQTIRRLLKTMNSNHSAYNWEIKRVSHMHLDVAMACVLQMAHTHCFELSEGPGGDKFSTAHYVCGQEKLALFVSCSVSICLKAAIKQSTNPFERISTEYV